MAETDEIIQIHGADGEGDKYPTTLAEAVLMEKNGDKTLVDALKEAGAKIAPGNMRSFTAVNNAGTVNITFKMPVATVSDNGTVFCTPAGVMIRRGTDGYPKTINDGELVSDAKVTDLEITQTLSDKGLETGKSYYYTAFPYSTEGAYNQNGSLKNRARAKTQSYICYGFRVDQRDETQDPDDIITTIPNPAYEISNDPEMKLAHMDFDKDEFDYGDWTRKEFFWPHSCMLKYDGTRDYYLDEDDESKKSTGDKSDYNNPNYGGNAMVEFPRAYYAFIADPSNKDLIDIYIANTKIDDNFVSPAFNDGAASYFYFAKYFGSNDGTRMRSISGMANTHNTNAQQELDYAAANGTNWTTGTKAQWDYFNLLLWLICGNSNSQKTVGRGRVDIGWHGKYEGIEPGAMDGKGQFWGSLDGIRGVKTFGVENPWGNMCRRIAGWCQGDGTTLIKLTAPYNTTGSGYISISDGSQAVNGFISKMNFDKRGFFYPSVCGGSESTKYCDHKWSDKNTYAFVGCFWRDGSGGGSVVVFLAFAASYADVDLGSSLSYTPVA